MGCPSGQHQCGTTNTGGAICCPNAEDPGLELAEQYESVRKKKGSKRMKRKNRIARRKAQRAAQASSATTFPTKQYKTASHQRLMSDLQRSIENEKRFRARIGCGAACGY